MKLITRNTDYALRALCVIAENKEVTSVSELVEKLKMPRPFLRKILQALNREGILKSCRGAQGGFVLAKTADRIFLPDLIRTFQGDFRINECIFRKAPCPNAKTCKVRKKLADIQMYAYSKLKSVSIGSLIK